MTRAVISGVTGHVGQELARQLVAAGVEVHGLTRAGSAMGRLPLKDLCLHRVNGQTETMIALFDDIRPDIVFHLAALARREHRSADVTPFINANIRFGAQLLEASRTSGCRRFVTAGSYLQHRENGDYRAFNLYAATKQAFEDLVAYYVDAYNFSAAVLTLCNVYGEHDPRPTLITDIASALTQDRPLHLHAEEAWVDLVHVEDVAAAFRKVMRLFESNTLIGGTFTRYSVSSGEELTSSDLVELFEKLGNRKVTVKRPERRHPARRVRPWRGSSVPGWERRVSLEDGLARILQKVAGGRPEPAGTAWFADAR